ncbi:GNAT family N-acetyltransferase [Uliginosibacterium gangwonense]|uniref:GNAT family N-acetyltransferase n=1 Tax=Uliginosibacterium gangwonense TaxID=392736 RepID=UPI000370205F|nr:GNAT family N-acetyltransferase [Uliginosibacterium gangwonense]
MKIRQASLEDAARICEIYNPFILDTTVTYELEAVSVEAMRERILAKQRKHDWLVAEDESGVLGYGYYGRFRERAAYDHVVESSIYLAPQARGKGLGTLLYNAIIHRAHEQGYREMIGVVALPNPASAALHESLGFAAVGTLVRSGFKFGRYLDTGIWQKSI